MQMMDADNKGAFKSVLEAIIQAMFQRMMANPASADKPVDSVEELTEQADDDPLAGENKEIEDEALAGDAAPLDGKAALKDELKNFMQNKRPTGPPKGPTMVAISMKKKLPFGGKKYGKKTA